ncbi:MAG TPA: hypothetical protein VM328_08225, partial [Fimbriimonadaceae bacterium]|nr:hypothetical protein [Fimbriimonadaceae bacterium]
MDKVPPSVEPEAPLVEEAASPVEQSSPSVSPASPWRFVPLLYFLQGLPVIAVQNVSATLFTKMGLETGAITVWSNLLKLPWTLKPFWGPLVDLNWTKRRWVVLMQALIFVFLFAAAISMTSANWFTLLLISFGVVAFLSATHDIAADGFYLLALDERRQAFFVGIRSAAFRLAFIFCTGGLVYLAGEVEDRTGDIARSWMVALGFGALIYGLGALVNAFAMPRPVLDRLPGARDPQENRLNLLRTAAVIL